MTTRPVRATTAVRVVTVDTAGMEAATAEAVGVGATEAAEVTAEAAAMADLRDSLIGLGYLPHRDDPEMAN